LLGDPAAVEQQLLQMRPIQTHWQRSAQTIFTHRVAANATTGAIWRLPTFIPISDEELL
jgi:hypothetical protein